MDNYYKGDKITTNGLSEQHIFEIKQKYHSGIPASSIADEMNLSLNQVLIAINQNETTPFEFKESDFK